MKFKQDRINAEIKVRLLVYNFANSPDSISALLGVPASETWLAGDPVLRGAANVLEENGWLLRSPVDPNQTTLEEAITALLDIFSDPEVFKRLPNDAEVQFGCAVFPQSEAWPSLSLSAKTLSRMAAVSASLDLDLYSAEIPRNVRKARVRN